MLNATLTVINKAGTAAADITLLNNAIKTVLQVMPLNLPVKLFGDGGVLDLQVVGGSVTSALQANVNALNILQTALVIANGQNLIDLGLNVPLLGVQSKVRIVEPPTIAVGGVGATATSAGIRVYLRINTSNIPCSVLSWARRWGPGSTCRSSSTWPSPPARSRSCARRR